MTAPSPRWAGLALVPAAVLVSTGLLQSASGVVVGRPDWLVHPALVLGGLALAVALAAADALRLRVERAPDAVTLRLDVRRRPFALAAIASAATFAAVIAVYLVAENLG
ncbi:hypothetical protein [Rubrivirga sp. IMCC45206]|uniref:hypothetical protein n=1 Tax=Rubrivirga sp. IMCC45206 TaxID=3391614 RepID=UPI00398FE0AD